MALPSEFYYITQNPSSGDVTIWKTPATSVLTSPTLAQQGVTATGRRPCIVPFRGDLYVVGSWSRPVYHTSRDPGWWIAGIKPPDQQFSLLAGVGGINGVNIAYITYQHRANGVLLAESNPSNFNQITLVNGSRIWGNLTTPRVERRVTHVAGYVSVGGSNYRRAFLSPYGITSIEESVPTNQLTIEGPSANYLVPAGVAFAVEFAGRMWYANTGEFPYRVWYSAAGQPQYVDLASFRDTTDRAEIVGMGVCQGVLILFTISRAYVIRAASSGAFVLDRLDSSFGCLSHFGIIEIHNKLWFPTQDGIAIYDGGGFSFIMKDMRPYWQADYLEHRDAFLSSYAVNEKIGKNYMLLTQRKEHGAFEDWSPGTVTYVGNYLNYERSMGGQNEQPDWTIDIRGRVDYSAFYGLDNRLYFGSEDGNLRVEDPTDADDEGDTLLKPLLIEHGCLLFQEPGDDVEMGKKLEQLWAYIESEANPWTLYVLMGDEWAASQYEPDNLFLNWKIDVTASALAQAIPDPIAGGFMGASYIQETVHYLGPEGVAGRGLAVRVRALSPVGMKYRGVGGAWAPGAGPRKEKEITRFDVTIDVAPLIPNPPPQSPLIVGSFGGQAFQVTLSNADLASYPVAITYTWTGAHVEVFPDTIVSGLASPAAPFSLEVGDSTLVITVTLGGVPVTKTFYFTAV